METSESDNLDKKKTTVKKKGYQIKSLSSSADIFIGGGAAVGAAGVGKTWTTLVEPLSHKDNKKKTVRGSTSSKELCEDICGKISEGGHIKKVLGSSSKYPTFQTWCNWKRKEPDLANMYLNAIQDKSESCIGNIYDIMDEVRTGELDSKPARVLIDAEKWLASKFYPKMFGLNSNLDVTTDGGKISQVSIFQIPENNREDD